MPIAAQIGVFNDSAVDEATLGPTGRTLHDSTGAGNDDGVGCWLYMLALAGELGSRGG